MRAVVQRVSSAAVRVADETVGQIGAGILLLAGCETGDTEEDFRWIAHRVANLRIFPPETAEDGGHFERSLIEVGGAVLAISQFTLLGDARKGRRPSFSDAMPVEEARGAFERFVAILKEAGLSVETGRFQEMMDVESINQGPVTILLDSRKRF
jgi:D-tyrosyl-tRNA(Tyr) deacylase